MSTLHLPQPHPHHHHPLTKAERDRLGGWTGLLWMDYLNADSGAALQIIEAEREEIAEYEAKHEAEEEQELQRQRSEEKPSPPKILIQVQEAPLKKKEANPIPVKIVEEEHPEWEMDSCEIGGFEDGIDDIEGPVWDDPLDRKSVERQMNGGVSLKKDESSPKMNNEERQDSPKQAPKSDSEDDRQDDLEALHRCSIDTLSLVDTDDLVAAAEALQISERNHKPRPQCSHCGGSRLRQITTADKARALAELLELEDAKAFFAEIGIQI